MSTAASSSAIVPTDNPVLSGNLFSDNAVVLSSFALFGISALVWVILSFLQRRTKKCLGCCGGRPGIVFPINFLNPRHRLVYVLACGALASTWFHALNTGDFSDVNKWAASIVKILSVIFLLSLEIFITFPLLACVETPVPIVGYILGAIYTDVLLASRIYVTVDVIQQQDVDGFPEDFVTLLYSKYVVSFLPQLVCITAVLVWYHYKIIKEMLRICRTNGTWTHA
ncbi:PREDICTED: uncharacterized protein LOC109589343 isoform X2 [Amphimedon queenslandica]|nr:PREDICTED: uncharacterized protein LOC109589343 isoform X2 [Amphimedon queenslandica]|eukprot:XP_019861006.1 PREDICTED: uncharacterized protein LOC109589343 isoform X2 [Amphimedon queenslandica]